MNEEKDSSKTYLLILLLVLLMIIGFIFGSKLFDYLNAKKRGGVSFTEAGYLIEKTGEVIGGSSSSDNFTIAGYGSISMKEGSRDAQLHLINPEENKDLFYLQFEIVLRETEELLYKSDLLEPGMEIRKIEMLRSFDKGDYEAVVRITPVMMDDPSALCNMMTYNIRLHVE